MNVNLFGSSSARDAARHMKDHGGGSIINNASIAAVNAGAGMISYRSSKAAIAHATKCMAIDLAPYGIRVNCLTPAHIRSGITNYDMGPVIKYMQPLEREAQPADVANAVAFLSSERAGADHRHRPADRRRHDRARRADAADHVGQPTDRLALRRALSSTSTYARPGLRQTLGSPSAVAQNAATSVQSHLHRSK